MKEQTIASYLEELSSAEGLPGGGSGAALIGAMAGALGKMVTGIYGKRKTATNQKKTLQEIGKESETLILTLTELMEADAVAFDEAAVAMRLPHQTKEEEKIRNQRIEAGLEKACMPPFDVMEASLKQLAIMERLTGLKIEGSIVNDIAVGIVFSRTSLEAAFLNVLVNAQMMKDSEHRQKLIERAENLKQTGMNKAEKTYHEVLVYLEQGNWQEVPLQNEGNE